MEHLDRVKSYVETKGLPANIKILAPASTKTSKSAADSLGCSVAEIAKTVAFISEDCKAVLVVLSGDKRVSLQALADCFQEGKRVFRRMSAEEVKDKTGYPVGGVPPFPHNEETLVLVDRSIFRFDQVWAAAGTPNSVMQVSPKLLTEVLNYETVQVSE